MKGLSKMTPSPMSISEHLSVLLELLKTRPGLLMANCMLLVRRGPPIVMAMHMMMTEANLKGNSRSVSGPPFISTIVYTRTQSLY